MNTKRAYCIPAVFVFWFLVLKFRVNVVNLVLCTIASAAMYYAISSISAAREYAPVQGPCSDTELDSVIELVQMQAAAIRGTALEKPLAGMLDCLSKIQCALQDDPSRCQNTYLRRFCSLYAEYSKGLISEYLSLSAISQPVDNIDKIRRLYEDRFVRLKSVTEKILNDIYGRKTMDLEAENRALEQVFAPLEQESEFCASTLGRNNHLGFEKLGLTNNAEGSNE